MEEFLQYIFPIVFLFIVLIGYIISNTCCAVIVDDTRNINEVIELLKKIS